MLFSGASRASHVSDEAFGIEYTMTDKLAKSETTSLRLPGIVPAESLRPSAILTLRTGQIRANTHTVRAEVRDRHMPMNNQAATVSRFQRGENRDLSA